MYGSVSSQFRRCVAKALEIPSPSCWMVCMSGVGAVQECPKKGLIRLHCQNLSAFCSIAVGLRDFVAWWHMICWLALSGLCLLLWVWPPKGRRMELAWANFWMVVSPCMEIQVIVSVLFGCIYLFILAV